MPVIRVKDHKQYDMSNPFEYLGPKRLALLESSWAQLFREEILHTLPVEWRSCSLATICSGGGIPKNFTLCLG
jgi:hypothetical protein